MKKIKISFLWNANITNTVIFNLIKILSQKEIEIVPVAKCDLLIFGPYEIFSAKRRLLNIINKKIKNIEGIFPNLDIYLLNRKIKPIRIFYSQENYLFPTTKYDFSITPYLGINNKNHLRYPLWKDLIDWSHLKIPREPDIFLKRFDTYYYINDLMAPIGTEFLKKEKKICIFSSHLNEPRKSILNKFSENFQVDGYGPFFNKNIKNHNSSNIIKKVILKNYAFNLCPENSLYPGYYTEKIPESFLGKSLPLTWTDNNVNVDFNEKSFVNLLNHTKDNYSEISYLLKDEDFLKKFTKEPLLLNKPNLDNEINFIKNILALL